MANILNVTQNLESLKEIVADLPTAVTIDATLTKTGQAADAKAVGDALATQASVSHEQAASTITAGTFAGAVVANSASQSPSTSLLRNSKLATEDTAPAHNGEICWTYE